MWNRAPHFAGSGREERKLAYVVYRVTNVYYFESALHTVCMCPAEVCKPQWIEYMHIVEMTCASTSGMYSYVHPLKLVLVPTSCISALQRTAAHLRLHAHPPSNHCIRYIHPSRRYALSPISLLPAFRGETRVPDAVPQPHCSLYSNRKLPRSPN